MSRVTLRAVNTILAFGAALVSLRLASDLVRRARRKRSPELTAWAASLVAYAAASAALAAGAAGGWHDATFRVYYLFGGLLTAPLLGVGSQLTVTDESDLVQAIRESTQQNVSRAGDQLTSRNLNIQPTITIRPGAIVRLVVHKDLILAPWRN